MSDDIKLPPRPDAAFPGVLVRRIPRYLFTADQMQAYARAAVEADRADHFRGVTEMVPSDEELLGLLQTCGALTTAAGIRAIRVALSRYGSSQPAARAEPVLVGWTVGVDGGGILHAAKYTEDEAKRAGYPLAVYRLARPKSAPVAQEPVATTGRTHSLKTDPEVFQAVFEGRKTFEIRVNDRGFRVGDELLLKETTRTGAEIKDGAPLEYTGRTCRRAVSHILTGYGLAENWCCLSFAAPVAAQAQQDDEEDRYSLLEQEHLGDPIRKTGIYSDAAQAQPTMPPLTDAMRAVLRNEHCVYDSEDALYAALCNAAGSTPSAQDREDDEALADTQRAIIEAAERRGYARAIAECAQDREDAAALRAILMESPEAVSYPNESWTDAYAEWRTVAIDAARAAKERA